SCRSRPSRARCWRASMNDDEEPLARPPARVTLVVALAAALAVARTESTAAATAPGPSAGRAQRVGGPGDHAAPAVAFDWFEAAERRSPSRQPVGAADDHRFHPPPADGSLGFRAHPVWLRIRLAYEGSAPASRILELACMPGLANLYR